MGADDLIANGKDVAVIDYHTGDIFENSFGLSRLNYYGLNGTPTAWFDGGNVVVGGNHTQSMYGTYLPKYNLRKAIQSSFTLNIEGVIAGENAYEVVITAENVDPTTFDNLVLHTALTESGIPQNWQGMTSVENCERLMFPNQMGKVLDFNSNDIIQVVYYFDMEPAWVPENCNIVTFIQNSQSKDIKQGTLAMVQDFVQYDLDASIRDMAIPQAVCQNIITPKIKIANNGTEAITSLNIIYDINGGTPQTFAWTGNLSSFEEEIVELGEMNLPAGESYTFHVQLENPNGNTDEFPANNSRSKLIETAQNVTSPVSLVLKLDDHPAETSWEVLDPQGNVIYEGGNYTTPNQIIIQQFDLENDGCYSFIIYDEGGDGLTGMGQYKIAYNGSTIFAEGYGFGFEDQVQFGIGLTGTNERIEQATFTMYPNPVDDLAYINFNMDKSDEVSLHIYNSSGEIIYQSGMMKYGVGNYTLTVDGSSWGKGVYFVKLLIGDKTYTRKMVTK